MRLKKLCKIIAGHFKTKKKAAPNTREKRIMPIDLRMMGDKLFRYREQLKLTFDDVSSDTGIDKNKIVNFESGTTEPNGGELLILSDYFKCDYRFFISNEKLAPFEQTDILYRKHGESFSKKDRWAIQEFLYLVECEQFLMNELKYQTQTNFKFSKISTNHKQNGIAAAKELRNALGYSNIEVGRNIYDDFRNIGLHVFRRELENSDISGLFINHPLAGKCILINYSEDVFRQRFTAAHEAAHSILDEDESVIVSFKKQNSIDYKEVGANYFASNYLIPSDFLYSMPSPKSWNIEKVSEWALKFKVSVEALVYALKNNQLIETSQEMELKQAIVPRESKIDPELHENLSVLSKQRKLEMLKRGLSDHYVHLCFKAFREQVISFGRLAEILLVNENELMKILDLYKENLNHVQKI